MGTAIQAIAHFHLQHYPEEAARVLERHAPAEIAAFLQPASVKCAASVLACFASPLAASCLIHWPETQRSLLLSQLPPSIAAALLRQFKPAVREEVLGRLPTTVRPPLDRALSYAAQSAGALADPVALTLHSDLTVAQALDRLSGSHGPIPSRLFVLDRSQRLLGAVTPGQLLGSNRNLPLTSLALSMARSLASHASATTLSSAAVSAEPLAVVDSEGIFLGAISANTLRGLDTPQSRSPSLHLLAAMAEFYSLGLSEIWSGPRSASRASQQPGSTKRVNP